MLFPLRDTISTRHRPVMTWTLIAVTSAVYVFEAFLHPQHLQQIAYLFGIVPARYSHPDWAARVVTLLLLLFWPLTFEMPAFFYLFYWFAIQLLSGTAALLGPEQMGGVAWWAHVGGFVAGVALLPAFVTKRRLARAHGEVSYDRRTSWPAFHRRSE